MKNQLIFISLALFSLTTIVKTDQFIFMGKDDSNSWKTWDWSGITHIGFWSDPPDDMQAQAHSKGVKLCKTGGDLDPKDWTDKSKRKDAIEKEIGKIKDKNYNCHVFDYEGNNFGCNSKC